MNLFSIIKAFSAIVVGLAFFSFGCQPKRIVEKPPEKPPLPDFFTLAEKDFASGNFEKAFKEYGRYLQENPRGEKPRMALYRMAKIRLRGDRLEEALVFLKRVFREYPEHPEAPQVRFDILKTYRLLGNYKASQLEGTQWVERYPAHPLRGEVLYLLGLDSKALGDLPKAFYWWLKALGEFEESSVKGREISQRLKGLINVGTPDELELMADFAAGTPFAPQIYHRVASSYLEDRDLEKARTAVMALIRSAPEQNWVDMGRKLIERIDEELSVKEGVIGCLLPLSGPFSIYGQEMLNGIQLGMGLFQKIGTGKELELIIKDTKGNEEIAVSEVEELVRKEKVMAIIGPLASKPALAAAKKAQELGVPIITLTQKDKITNEGEMVFRNFLTPTKEINEVLDRAVYDKGWIKYGILYPDNSYGRFFMNLFWDRLEEMGGAITAVESYNPDDTDFADQIKKMVGLYYPRPESVLRMLEEMKDFELDDTIEEESEDADDEVGVDSEEEPEPIVDFDAVFIPDNYQQVALIAPQFPFHDVFDIHFLGTSLWQSDELVQLGGEYIQNSIFPSGFFLEDDLETTQDFSRLYKENFESNPGILAATGYDTMRFVTSLIRSVELRTRGDFKEGLLSHDHPNGVTGQISFDSQGEVEKKPLLMTVSGRRLKVIQ